MKKTYHSETKVFNNQTCPAGLKQAHAVSKGFEGELHVISGMVEFVWEDTKETITIDSSKPFLIEQQRKHHLNLLWDVEFKVIFYKID